ncbi:DUF4145 domain-containing protein [Mariprofundus ferrooxydans]|uniref:DUF4145 domain-containing protein n=1 Tax=Mariprofundus ferrooxydans PV-1 TaxID=314345 RepID=Q0F0Z5_9PROT|nr:DUF4145 domain-containing protein [Mariprofundus ferrooxydans]EAU55396.1 hypothetical protein SPV1_11706 [Mariprofundus ferrooxydans PV-1]KON47688.1 hypothetical protein AL013_06875 [Mariprofundus ferrooxydans]
MDLSPKFKSDKFQCPHCLVASQQRWFDVDNASGAANNILKHVFYDYRKHIQGYQQKAIEGFIGEVESANNRHMSEFVPDDFSVATCSACGDISIWVEKEIVYPKKTPVAPPNADMDQEIQNLYVEASTIVVDSPKGATALLRLALQLLLKQLGKSGKNINNDIKALVAEGLSPKIQQALDLLRVVGNNAVHPGQIDLEDGREIALRLFHVLNFIADEMISKPKELDLLYSDVVPEETKKHINERDGK